MTTQTKTAAERVYAYCDAHAQWNVRDIISLIGEDEILKVSDIRALLSENEQLTEALRCADINKDGYKEHIGELEAENARLKRDNLEIQRKYDERGNQITRLESERLKATVQSEVVTDETALREAVAESISSLYGCGRVWSAWNVGTMTQDDFYGAGECDECIDQVMDAIRPYFATLGRIVEAQPADQEWKLANAMWRMYNHGKDSNQVSAQCGLRRFCQSCCDS